MAKKHSLSAKAGVIHTSWGSPVTVFKALVSQDVGVCVLPWLEKHRGIDLLEQAKRRDEPYQAWEVNVCYFCFADADGLSMS